GVFRAAFARAAASEIGVPLRLEALSSLAAPALPALPLAAGSLSLTWSGPGVPASDKPVPDALSGVVAPSSGSTFSASGRDPNTLARLLAPTSGSIFAGSICEY